MKTFQNKRNVAEKFVKHLNKVYSRTHVLQYSTFVFTNSVILHILRCKCTGTMNFRILVIKAHNNLKKFYFKKAQQKPPKSQFGPAGSTKDSTVLQCQVINLPAQDVENTKKRRS